jgi:2-isopropylmalate synthase
MEGVRPSFFEVESWRVIVESGAGPDVDQNLAAEATVKVHAGGERIVSTGEGNGPVNALDHALRHALGRAYPGIEKLELVDYRVRILDGGHGTDAVTRVLVETSDGETSWQTVGVAANVIEASWQALVDAVTYGLLRHEPAAEPGR